MAEGTPLLRERGSKAHRGFESLPLRQHGAQPADTGAQPASASVTVHEYGSLGLLGTAWSRPTAHRAGPRAGSLTGIRGTHGRGDAILCDGGGGQGSSCR